MINLTLIDKEEQRIIAKIFLPLIEDYFKDELHVKKFEEWKAKRNK